MHFGAWRLVRQRWALSGQRAGTSQRRGETVNETYVTIVGRVINKPEHRQTGNDVELTKFRLASNERRYDRESGTWVDGDRLFVNVTCWRRLAFGAHACLDKGDPVVVTGRLYTRGFEVEGQRRSMIELDATAIGPDLSKCTVTVHRRRESQPGRPDDVGHDTRDDLGNLGPAGAFDEQPASVAA
jgi:single-strand DNA-binding protein